MTDVSLILPVRDMERTAAEMVRTAAAIEQEIVSPDGEPVVVEILALDERSGDNTLSVLSVLHGQCPGLRTLQDVAPGTAIRRAARVARGEAWLVMDHVVDPSLGAWAINQVLRGHRAAVVPGEVLAVERALGQEVLAGLSGGLVSGQNAVVRYLRGRGEPPVFSPAPKRGAVHSVRLLVRGGLGRLGLARFDRPRGR